MKLFDFGVGVLIFLLAAGGVIVQNRCEKKIPPVEVKVIEAESGEAMEDVLVYYRLSSAYLEHSLGIPAIDPFHYRDLVKQRFFTDKEGLVYIEEKEVNLKLYGRIMKEVVGVNYNPAWAEYDVSILETYNYYSVSSKSGELISESMIRKDGAYEDYYENFTIIDDRNWKGDLIGRKVIVELEKKE